ncbi:MAG: GxxExxY protein [Planctomycetota bacterium]
MSDRHHRQTLRDDELDPALAEVSRLVIGCAIDIHNTLGPGFTREVYENALAFELEQEDVKHVLRHTFDVRYDGHKVGEHVVSLYVDERFFVDVIEAHGEIGGFERSAMRARLRAGDVGLGLMINFNRPRLKDGGLVRVLNPDKIDAIKGSGAPAHATVGADEDGDE